MKLSASRVGCRRVSGDCGASGVFFCCVINSLRTGQARPAFRKQAYTRRKHPRAFALTLLIWLAWVLLCLYPAFVRAQAVMRAFFSR